MVHGILFAWKLAVKCSSSSSSSGSGGGGGGSVSGSSDSGSSVLVFLCFRCLGRMSW